jgi:hypothetical protein
MGRRLEQTCDLDRRSAWFTISVVYQTTWPSFFAAAISAASAAPAVAGMMSQAATAKATVRLRFISSRTHARNIGAPGFCFLSRSTFAASRERPDCRQRLTRPEGSLH